MIEQSILLHVQQSIYYTSSCGQSICNLILILYPIILAIQKYLNVYSQCIYNVKWSATILSRSKTQIRSARHTADTWHVTGYKTKPPTRIVFRVQAGDTCHVICCYCHAQSTSTGLFCDSRVTFLKTQDGWILVSQPAYLWQLFKRQSFRTVNEPSESFTVPGKGPSQAISLLKATY